MTTRSFVIVKAIVFVGVIVVIVNSRLNVIEMEQILQVIIAIFIIAIVIIAIVIVAIVIVAIVIIAIVIIAIVIVTVIVTSLTPG